MAPITKPGWLEMVLSWLNWDVFFVHIEVGETIEGAIDWVITWLNWILFRAESADSKAEDVRARTKERADQIETAYRTTDQEIMDQLEAMPLDLMASLSIPIDEIRAEAKRTEDAIRAELMKLYNESQLTADQVDILSRDLVAARDYLMNVTAKELAQLREQLARTEGGLDALGARVVEIDEKQTSIWEMIRYFFTDPAKFVYELFDIIIERFW